MTGIVKQNLYSVKIKVNGPKYDNIINKLGLLRPGAYADPPVSAI